MINELYTLAKALDEAGLSPQKWHPDYLPIPKITKNAPCICIKLNNGEVADISRVPTEKNGKLRKFGNNQGSFPFMNLAPLYRITDSEIARELKRVKDFPELIDADRIREIKSWCTENNWQSKLQNKYKICLNRANELRGLVPDFEPIQILTDEFLNFSDPMTLHRELERKAFEQLELKEDVVLALTLLFYNSNPEKKAGDDYGSLSFAFNSSRLIDKGMSVLTNEFVSNLNKALLASEAQNQSEEKGSGEAVTDAFGISFAPDSKSMPKVKLAGGFDVVLRTMFDEHKCQYRYGKIKNESYALSPEMRLKLHAALNWIGASKEEEDKTWIKIDDKEVLFAFPERLPETDSSFTEIFKGRERSSDMPDGMKKASFENLAEKFISELKKGKNPECDSNSDNIYIFILKAIDNARVKIVYTRQTDAGELEKCCEAWTLGCSNLPKFEFGSPFVPFPLYVSDILNNFWKQSGERIKKQFKPVPKYRGLELLFDPSFPAAADFHMLVQKAMSLGSYAGTRQIKSGDFESGTLWNIKGILALSGLFLYRRGIAKEDYMENFAYLYGQLLKISDRLHAVYCEIVRKGQLPSQLAGSGLYLTAAEAPIRTLSVLGQRMNPYISWAKTYNPKEPEEEREDNSSEKNKTRDEKKDDYKNLVKWLLRAYEKTVAGLEKAWKSDACFTDEEKAQFFIGYLAALPKSDRSQKEDETETYVDEVNIIEES